MKLQQSLQELREQYENQTQESREDIKEMFEKKLKAAEAQIGRYSTASCKALDDLRNARQQIAKLKEKNTSLESDIDEMKTQIK